MAGPLLKICSSCVLQTRFKGCYCSHTFLMFLLREQGRHQLTKHSLMPWPDWKRNKRKIGRKVVASILTKTWRIVLKMRCGPQNLKYPRRKRKGAERLVQIREEVI